jgi:hypothetical protein
MDPDIPFGHGPKQGIAYGMDEDVGIGVSG